jgi:hypothetical protein
MPKSFFNILFFTLAFKNINAQTDTLKPFQFTAYADFYYSYDFGKPANNQRPNFIYNHKRHNEINTNLIFGKANYQTKNLRANLGLMVGNYAQYNLANEPSWAQFVWEANLGIKLSNKNNIWLDVGILPSHIGFESAVTADNWTLTRSLLADNSPYYETGAKLQYQSPNQQWTIAALALNGWQNVQRKPGINKAQWGAQIKYTPNSNCTINYSNFIGSDVPDSLNTNRFFNNTYWQQTINKNWAITCGFDWGMDKPKNQKAKTWYSPVIIIKYSPSQQTSLAARYEYYNDKDNVITSFAPVNQFKINGFSLNGDYKLRSNVLLRLEGKLFSAANPIFNQASRQNFLLTTSLSCSF